MKVKNKFEDNLMECPFCKRRKTGNERFCFGCNLDFKELENPKIKDVNDRKKKNKFCESNLGEIVYAPILPDDVNYSQFKILTLFLGLFGAHSFYIGRIWKGIIQLFLGIIAIGSIILYNALLKQNLNILFYTGLFVILALGMWLVDLFSVLRKKYKFPILLKTPIDVNSILQAGKK